MIFFFIEGVDLAKLILIDLVKAPTGFPCFNKAKDSEVIAVQIPLMLQDMIQSIINGPSILQPQDHPDDLYTIQKKKIEKLRSIVSILLTNGKL